MATRKTAPKKQAAARDDSKFAPLELIAVSHLGKKADDVRDLVDAGDAQQVDVTVQIFGGINVGTPTSYQTMVKPSLEDLMALALMGSANAVSALTDRLAKAYRRLAAEDSPTIDENLRKQAREILESLGRQRTIHQRGRVSASLNYEILERK